MNEETVSIKYDLLQIIQQRSRVFLLVVFMALSSIVLSQQINKVKVIVLSDIEADPDGTQSLVRFLTYSNQWDVDGLIATTSIHQQIKVAPESIFKVLDTYKKINPIF